MLTILTNWIRQRRLWAVAIVTIVLLVILFWILNPPKTLSQVNNKARANEAADSQYLKERMEYFEATDKAEFFKQQQKKRSAHLQKFLDKGWRVSNSPPPIKEIIELSTEAIPRYEKQMQEHLQTNSFEPGKSAKIAAIILKSEEEKTRYVGLEALARSNHHEAQQVMMELFAQLPDTQQRSLIIGGLSPQDPQDGQSQFLLQTLSQNIEPRLKREAAMSLMVMALVNAKGEAKAVEKIYRNLLDRVPETFIPDFEQIYAKVVAEFVRKPK